MTSLTKTFYFSLLKRNNDSTDFIDKEVNEFLIKNNVTIQDIYYDMGEGYIFVYLYYDQ